jgi:hypothetical protein
MLKDIDESVSQLLESLARFNERRRFVKNTVKGVFAILTGLSVAQFTGLKEAFAASCTCSWLFGQVNCPGTSGCPPIGGCPSAYSVCTSSNDPNHLCPYYSGSWISCSGLGTCGQGFRICTDCFHLSLCGGDYCTCQSGILCGYCCSKQAVEEEMHRVAASLKASAEIKQEATARC